MTEQDFTLLRLRKNHAVNIMLVHQDMIKFLKNARICVYKDRNPRWSQERHSHSFFGILPSWDLTPQDQQNEIIEDAQNDLAFDFRVLVNGTSTYFSEG